MKQDKNLKWHPVDAERLDLRGMKVVIVGGTGGIGRAISRFMAAKGADVVVVGQTFRDSDQSRIQFVKADLSLMKEAQRVAGQLPVETADLILFTTGVMAGPQREVTAEGIERDMAVSYLSRLVMLRQIAGRLGKNRPDAVLKPRVFIMGYPGAGQTGQLDDLNAEKSYGRMKVHMNTVAGNEMLVLDAVRRYPQANFFGLNPGLISTNIRSNLFGSNKLLHRLVEWLMGLLAPSADAYARRLTSLLVSPDLEGHSGAMFNQKAQAILPSPNLTDSHVKAFLAGSEALLNRVNIAIDA